MPDKSSFLDVWSNRPYNPGSREHKQPPIPRHLGQYEILLRFNHRLFDGASVMDFGCGGTNLQQELRRAGITPRRVVMLDNDPSVRTRNPDVTVLEGTQILKKFDPRSIDFVLALASTYQIPLEERTKVFTQLLKVAKRAVHISPIYSPDYSFLAQTGLIEGFEVVACRPYASSLRDTLGQTEIIFEPATLKDYDDFKEKYPESTRIIPPLRESPIEHRRIFFHNLDIHTGSSYIVLKRPNLGT